MSPRARGFMCTEHGETPIPESPESQVEKPKIRQSKVGRSVKFMFPLEHANGSKEDGDVRCDVWKSVETSITVTNRQ
jgi:hypothetical protein